MCPRSPSTSICPFCSERAVMIEGEDPYRFFSPARLFGFRDCGAMLRYSNPVKSSGLSLFADKPYVGAMWQF